jgi:hypothetical protein
MRSRRSRGRARRRWRRSTRDPETKNAETRGLTFARLAEAPPGHYAIVLERSNASGTMAVILDNKEPSAPSVFRPEALLREARRQKALAAVDVPAICILDPDGDIVRRLRREG